MMTKQFSPWKKSLLAIFLLFYLSLSLTAQDSPRSPETTPVKNFSNPPGDILTSTSFTGNRKILFLPIKYQGDANGIVTTSELKSHRNMLIANLERNAYESLSLTIDIAPTLTMPNPDTYYKNGPIHVRMRADAAKVAAQAGFDIDSYDREIIFSRKIWSGPSALGLNKRTAFMSHNLDYVSIHELGHTFGWLHANFWKVKSGFPYPLNGKDVEYGDKFDLMGGSAGPNPPYTANKFHLFNPWLKYRVGWIPEESILTVTNSGTYTIQALDDDPMTGTSVTKYTALKIKKDPLTDYWIFFRSLEESINYGPVITRNFNDNIWATRLLDMTPGSQNDDWRDAALAEDSTFSDTQAGIFVKTVSASQNEVQVEVTVDANALAAIDRLPVMDVVNPASGVTIQGLVDYEATAFDPDFGTFDGAGINRLQFYLHPRSGGDALSAALRQGLEPPSPVASVEFSAPPYLWQVDTDTGSIPDAQYFFIVRATSVDGGTHAVLFEHMIDNTALPSAPALSSPSDNATNVSTDITLLWSSSTAATSYQVQVSTLPDFSTTLVNQSGLTSTSYQVIGLSSSTTYYWRVRAKNAAGPSAWSPAWQFSTVAGGSAPAAPALSSPTDTAVNLAINPTLVWNASSIATSYRLQVSTVSNFSTTEVDQSGLTSTSLQVSGLANNTIYYWRVNAINVSGTSLWSTAWQFTTIVAEPAAPTLSSPADNASGISTSPTLVWDASSRANSYQVQVSTQSDFSSFEVDQSGLTAPSFQLTGLSNSTSHYWRVRATNAGGTSPWSTVWQFATLLAGPAAPVLSAPADNATDISMTPTLVWNTSGGATSYEVQVSTQQNFATVEVDQNGISATSLQATGLSNSTTHYWRVRATNAGGTSPWSAVWQFTTEPVSSVETGKEIPSDFRLGQNYPNPFNPTTNISFDLPKAEYVILKVYSLLGKEIATLVSGNFPAGRHIATFDASGQASGVYLYKLQSSSFVQTKKMLLVR